MKVLINVGHPAHVHLFKNMIDDLRGRCHIIRYSAWSSPENVQRILKEHRLFIKSFEEKDVNALDMLAEQHITHAKDFYLMQLRVRRSMANYP